MAQALKDFPTPRLQLYGGARGGGKLTATLAAMAQSPHVSRKTRQKAAKMINKAFDDSIYHKKKRVDNRDIMEKLKDVYFAKV